MLKSSSSCLIETSRNSRGLLALSSIVKQRFGASWRGSFNWSTSESFVFIRMLSIYLLYISGREVVLPEVNLLRRRWMAVLPSPRAGERFFVQHSRCPRIGSGTSRVSVELLWYTYARYIGTFVKRDSTSWNNISCSVVVLQDVMEVCWWLQAVSIAAITEWGSHKASLRGDRLG